MPSTASSIMPMPYRLLTVPVLAVLAVLAALLSPMPARAHAELVEATPAPNGTVVDSPEAVELRFTEPIDPDLAFIDVLDPAQQPVEGVGTVTVGDDGRVAAATLPRLEPGVYTVSWQVVSTVDGHATTGAFAFVIDPTGTEAPPTAPPRTAAPAVDGWAVAARWAGLVGGLVVIGSLTTWWRSRRLLPAGDDGRPPWALVATAATLSAVGLAAYLWLAARPIVDAVPERGGFPLDVAAPFGWTPFAIAMRVAIGGALLIAGLASAARAGGARRDGALAAGAVILGGVTLGGMSMAAHAAAIGGVGSAAVDWLHLAGVAVWLGGLPAVAVLARRPAGAPALGRSILRHHGPVAIVAAPLVALTGIANSPLVLGGARDLVASEYGNLLLAKAGLLSVALAIGAVNHFALRGRGRANVAALVGVELAVAAVAVSIAATMVTIQPASARQPAIVSLPVAPAHLFGEAGPVSVHATIDLPTPGTQRFLVTVSDAETGEARDDVQLVFVELGPPANSGLPPARVDLQQDPERPTLHTATGAHMAVEGDWSVDVVVRRSGALDERASFEVPVRRPAPPQRVPPEDTGVGVPAPLAVLWALLPEGPLGWLPAGIALLAVPLVGLGRRAGPTIGLVRIGLVAVAVLAIMGVGSRALVAGANAPTPVELADQVPPADFRASVEEGEAIYRANCAGCHGLDGDGEGPVRTLPDAGPLPDVVAEMPAAELSYRIHNGVAGTAMPAFAATLTEEERWHLVTYLKERWTRP